MIQTAKLLINKIKYKLFPPFSPSAKWLQEPDISIENPILIGGSGRSGTTLMGVILNSHPWLFCGEEFGLFIPNRFPLAKISKHFNYNEKYLRELVKKTPNKVQFLEILINQFKQREKIKRFVIKDPTYIFHLQTIFQSFPNAQFIYMCRDGRDVAVSMRNSQKQIGLSKDVDYNQEGLLSIEYCAKTWKPFIDTYRYWINDSRCHLVKYEELVTQPEITINNICQFLNIPYNLSMQNFNQVGTTNRDDLNLPHLVGVKKPFYSASISQWQTKLTTEEVKKFEEYAGAELTYLGYNLNTKN
jgi:protein-tyrosine sulfotransferase